MKRRIFLKNTLLAGCAPFILKDAFSAESFYQNRQKTGRLLNAYYFRAHMYTLVPRHIREDLKWMADIGTNIVSVAILEQDFDAAVENVEFICTEAEKLGMMVYAVPSRWGGLIAGAPKVPSVFTVRNPQTWILNKDGEPVDNGISGRISSIHYPETFEFVCTSLEKIFKTWNIKGIIWDELKTLFLDYSPKAIEKLGAQPTIAQQIQSNVDFYSEVNKFIKDKFKSISTNLFVYSNMDDFIVKKLSTIKYLDYYGCDGRPWRNADGGVLEGSGKVLLGIDGGERFIEAAKEQHKKSLWLIENHNMPDADIPLLEKRMPEVLSKEIDHLIYYYYPRNIQSPDKLMDVMKKHLLNFKRS